MNTLTTKKDAELLEKLADDVRRRVEDEAARRRAGGPIPSPLGAVSEGGSMFNGTRPYAYLSKDELQRLEEVDAQVGWSEKARTHISLRDRTGALEQVLAAVVAERADAQQKLTEAVENLERVLQEYTFLFPLDNVELPKAFELRIGRALLRPVSSKDWKRYCQDVYSSIERLPNTPEEKGAIIANNFLSEHELRPDKPLAVLEARAWGSPESALQQARDDAHFAIATLTFFNKPWSERTGQLVAIKGENHQRERGWRLRFGAGSVGPWMWHDGTGPGLPYRQEPVEKWNKGTKDYIAALNRILDSDPKSPAGRRLITAIYWVGSALNQPVLTREPSFPREGPEAKPSGIDVGRRIRDLTTGTATLLKKAGVPPAGELGDSKALGRLKRIVTELDAVWVDKHWPSIDSAYMARNAWTHEGIGEAERAGAEALAAALQVVIPILVIEAAKGTVATDEQLLDWSSPQARGA